jgi:ribokinase
VAGVVVVVGSLNIDLVTSVERLPRPGETVLGGDLRRLPGGKGANQALAAAAAGASASLIGRVGADPLGERYRVELARRGVDTTAVRVTPDVPTGQAFIAVAADGENSIVVMPGANAAVTVSDVDQALTARGTVVLLQLELPLPVVRHAALRAAALGNRVVLNASPARALPDDLLRLADPLLVNRHEAALVGGVPRSLVTTRGGDGAAVSTGGPLVRVPAPAVEVVDTTGAGDVFAGTLAARLAEGVPLLEAVRPAVSAASRAVTRPGAQDWDFAP